MAKFIELKNGLIIRKNEEHFTKLINIDNIVSVDCYIEEVLDEEILERFIMRNIEPLIETIDIKLGNGEVITIHENNAYENLKNVIRKTF